MLTDGQTTYDRVTGILIAHLGAFGSSELINCKDDIYFLCDRVCTQSKKLKDDILVAFDRENVGWKMVYNFLGIDEKT